MFTLLDCLYLPFCSEAVVTQVLDELGIQVGDELAGLPQVSSTVGTTVKDKGQPIAATSDADADLQVCCVGKYLTYNDSKFVQARLENLRRE